MLIADVPPIPAYKLICKTDPRTAVSNRKPAPQSIKKSARFTLTMAEGAIPIGITPRNLASPAAYITHLLQEKPRRVGEAVQYRLEYEQPLFPPSKAMSLEESNDFARLHVEGLLTIDFQRLRFQLEQTLQIRLNPSVPVTERQDLQIDISGTCVERAINPPISLTTD